MFDHPADDLPGFFEGSRHGSLFSARVKSRGDALLYRIAIKNQQSTARDEQESDEERNDCNSHKASLNVHVDDFANDQAANHNHAACCIQKLDAEVALPENAHQIGVNNI